MKKLGSKQYFYILMALAIVSLLSIVGVLYYGSQRLSETNKETAVLLAERDIALDKQSQLNAIAAQTSDSEEVESTVTAIIPKEKEQENLVAEIINKATQQANIQPGQIITFSFSGGDAGAAGDLSGTSILKSPAGVYEYPFSMAIAGISYNQLLTLFSEIESNQRLIQISTVDITPNADNPDRLDVNLTMKAYVQP